MRSRVEPALRFEEAIMVIWSVSSRRRSDFAGYAELPSGARARFVTSRDLWFARSSHPFFISTRAANWCAWDAEPLHRHATRDVVLCH